MFSNRAPILFISIIVIMTAPSCDETSDKKIPRPRMVQIYADVLIINSMLDLEESANYDERLDSVLTHHSVDRELFTATLEYYRQDPHRWKDLINRVVTELENRRDALQEGSSTPSSS